MNEKITDQDLTLRAAQTMVRDFCVARGWDAAHTPKDLAIGLVTEAAELLELFRFVTDARVTERLRDEDQRTQIADELADSLYCVLRFAQLYGFDLATALREKLAKNAVKYPAP